MVTWVNGKYRSKYSNLHALLEAWKKNQEPDAGVVDE